MAKIAYIRVSSIDQNTNRQEEMLKTYQIDKFFIEKSIRKKYQRSYWTSKNDGICTRRRYGNSREYF